MTHCDSYKRLSDLVQQFRDFEQPRPSDDLRKRAAALAWAVHDQRAGDVPELVNIAALALSFDHHYVLHELSSGVIGLVADTDLRTVPGEPPHLLRGAWLVQSRRLGEPLFGSTVCVGGYPLDGSIYLVGLQYPDGAVVAVWTPKWGERETEVEESYSPLISDIAVYREFGESAARFAVVLGLLLDAEGVPMEIRERPPRRAPRTGEWHKGQDRGPAVRYITIPRRSAVHWSQMGRVDSRGKVIPKDRVVSMARVRGHLRRVVTGEAGKDRRWIWVESYEARRWAAPVVRIRVDSSRPEATAP